MFSYDVLVIGGGMAGASIGSELARDRSVGLLDMEATLAHHTTGRSAALFLESYGGRTIRFAHVGKPSVPARPAHRLRATAAHPTAIGLGGTTRSCRRTAGLARGGVRVRSHRRDVVGRRRRGSSEGRSPGVGRGGTHRAQGQRDRRGRAARRVRIQHPRARRSRAHVGSRGVDATRAVSGRSPTGTGTVYSAPIIVKAAVRGATASPPSPGQHRSVSAHCGERCSRSLRLRPSTLTPCRWSPMWPAPST